MPTDEPMTLARFAAARHAMWLKKSYDFEWSAAVPEDVAELGANHYTNLWRELDRNSIYLMNEIQRPAPNPVALIMDTIIFRLFNKIETWEAIRDAYGDNFIYGDELHGLLRRREKNFTGAYVRCCDLGLVCATVNEIQLGISENIYEALVSRDVKAAKKIVRSIYSIGDFLTDQLMMDLIWDNGPFDLEYVPAFGPGAKRGLQYCIDSEQSDVLQLLEQVNAAVPPEYRPWADGRPVAFGRRELEHTLCEYFKYVKLKQADGKKVKIRTYNKSERVMDTVPAMWMPPNPWRRKEQDDLHTRGG